MGNSNNNLKQNAVERRIKKQASCMAIRIMDQLLDKCARVDTGVVCWD
jgi:hypothetical protein